MITEPELTPEQKIMVEKSEFLLSHDIQLGDLWNIMDDFNFSHVDEAIEHCWTRLKNNKSIWSR